ncbi:MAG: hypothetical protein V3W08_07405 [Candidatus Binatia bacterium]
MDIQSWDRDIRIAVLVSVMFETWTEGRAPGYSPMTTPLKTGGQQIGTGSPGLNTEARQGSGGS